MINRGKESVMCIPHGATTGKDSGYIEVKPKKHIEKVSKDVFEHGDSSFVDERVKKHEELKVKKSFFSSLFTE